MSEMEQLLRDFLGADWAEAQFAPVPKGQSGDLAMNFFALTKKLGKSPIEIAQDVQQKLESCEMLEKSEISGPYLNLFFASEVFFQQVLNADLQSDVLKNQKIMLEYSGPNTNKPLHLGHMRNHALGIATANLLEAAGAEVTRVNIINDKGLALAKTMLAYDRFGNGVTPESENKKSDHFVGDWYVRYETEFQKDNSLAEELPEIMQKWEAGDEKWVSLWKQITTWVIAGMEQTYKRQGVWFEKAYIESDLYKDGVAISEKGLKDGVFQKNEDGAIVIDLEEENLGTKVVLRADGTAIYLTNDLATAKQRFDDYSPDRLIYVVADEQAYYFKTLFASLEKLGLIDRKHLHHLAYGLVNLPDGRMKSREGTVVDADNLMDELAGIAEAEIKKRHEDLSDEDVKKLSEQIMNASWKFFLLSTSPNKTVTFDKEKSIAFEGSTGPYLQYAGVRLKAIFRKAEEVGIENREVGMGEVEKKLGVKILEFSGVLTRGAENYNPTYLVTYLLELAQEWSRYYAEHSILKAESDELKASRLALAHKVYDVLEKGLGILGIEIPEKM